MYSLQNLPIMPSTLVSGDIAFSAFQSDNTGGGFNGDAFEFVLLVPVTTGTTIYFTDSGYRTDSNAFRTNEGLVRWVAQTDLPAGTVRTFVNPGGTGVASTVEWTGINTTTGAVLPAATIGLATNGDNVTALINPVFGGVDALTGTAIAAITWGGSTFAATFTATSGNATTALAPGLNDGVNAISLAATDDGRYNDAAIGSVESGTLADVRASLNNDAYWTTSATPLSPHNTTANFVISSAATLPTLTISALDPNAAEAGQDPGTIRISSSTIATSPINVNFTIVSGAGQATNGVDYASIPFAAQIATGSSFVDITITPVDDTLIEGDETFTINLLSSPPFYILGSTTSATVTIADDDFVATNTVPVIVADNETVIDPERVTVFLNAPNSSPIVAPTAFVSGVINDPTDPARTIGIEFNVTDAETPNALIVTATSSNTAVVANANLAVAGTGNSRNLKITPTGVGYSDITVTVSDGSLSSSYVIKYAASAAGATTSRFLTGASNASTAIAIDAQYMLVGDDENQALHLYDRTNSGLAINSFDYTSSLGLTDTSGGLPREVDIEASAQLGNRIYWLGSQSNTDPAGNNRPNRDRIFATDKAGSGNAITLSYAGRYDFLREDIIAWDVNNGHGKGANFYGLAASAATGVSSKANNGYNIEGLEFAPDNSTAYVAFRAPQEPTGSRTKALIVPVTNFTSLLNASGGGTQGTATFGAPIELDLGGRGIREIRKNANNQYVIIAGSAGAEGAAPNDFQLYTWTGVATDAPVFRTANLSALNVGGSFESIVEVPTNLTSTSQLQLLIDNGDTVFYNDGTIAKNVNANFQKSRSEIVTLGNSIARIHDIQGSSTTFNTAFGGSQTIEGIVTRAFTGSTKLNGFFVQEEDADADSNTATSEAIFVFDTSGTTVNVGDKVRVTGTVREFTSTTSSLTQLDTAGVTTNIVKLGAGILPTTTNIQLPVVSTTDLERYEGMLVNISAASGDLTVTENFQLGRFGQIVLAANGSSNQPGTDARLDQYTQFNAPSVSGYSAYLADIAKRKIYLDDGSGTQNLDPILFGRNGNPLSATNTLRSGDTVSSITGILDERFEGYRIQTTDGVNFTAANPRPTTPQAVGGTLKVANFNILNYFNDLGSSTTTFVNDAGQTLTLRGANNAVEFDRQRDKIIQAIIGSGADVLGLNEVENNGFGVNSAIQNLVNGLNAIVGAGTYAFIQPPTTTPKTTISTDAITVGIIYKTGQVTPVGNAAIMPLGYSADFDLVGRRPLAQTFEQISNGQQFTAVVNHLKSKGSSSGGVGDADAGDGQGLSNGTRTREARDLATWLATKPTGSSDADYIILGDLNAYAKEDPLTTLANSGYENLLPITSYSYVFDGQVGSLDHALANNTLAAQVTSAEKWHINADEPSVLDYNTEFKTSGQIGSLYSASPFRSSDHDPIVVGLSLNAPVVIESAFSSQLVTVNNKYFAYDPLPNRFTNIKYAGVNVGTDSYQGWSVIGAESIGTDSAKVIWKSTSGLYWYSTNSDNGGIVTNIIPYENEFQQDFNGDGVIGATSSTIESAGTTKLSIDNNGRYVANNGGLFDVGILYSLKPVGLNDFPGWSVIGAEITDGEVKSMWKSTSGLYWYSTNSDNGGIVADVTTYEFTFQQDFDQDGFITQIGTAGDDTLGGSSANDRLTGGAGVDTFVLKAANNGVDYITDFETSEFLDISSFNISNFSSTNLRVGAAITTANGSNQFILNSNDGKLYFDADGAGGSAAVQLVTLQGVSSLTIGNFRSGISV
jgi:predicted extracellular nuclease